MSRKGYAETTVYSDADGDSRFHESLELEVATSAARNLDKMRFTFDANGDVLTAQEQKVGQERRRAVENERIDANEDYRLASGSSSTKRRRSVFSSSASLLDSVTMVLLAFRNGNVNFKGRTGLSIG